MKTIAHLPLRLAVPLLAFCLLSCPASLRSQTLLNGSFESPSTDYLLVTPGDDWARIAPGYSTGGMYVVSNNFGYGTTPYGTQYLQIDEGCGVSQDISGFQVGALYHLSMACSAWDTSANPHVLTMTVSGGAAGTQSFNLPTRASSSGPLPLATYSLDFTVLTSTPVTVTLSDAGNLLAFDNVTLTAAPEPSTWVVLLGGLSLLVGTARPRRARGV